MSEFLPSCQSSTPGLFNRSQSGWHHYQVIGAAETIILPSLIGIICSTGLVGNILIVFTIIRTQKRTIPYIYNCNLVIADLVHIISMTFLIHQWARGGEWVFGSPLCTIITSLDACRQFTCSAIVTAMSLDRLHHCLLLQLCVSKMQLRYSRYCLFQRYLALVQPFNLTHLRTRSKTIQVNLYLWVASLILMFPVWVYSKVIKFKDNLEGCTFALTSPDDVLWYTFYLTITTFFFPLPLIFICYILILCYTWEIYQQNKKAGSYTTSIPRQRVMRLTKMVLALVSVFGVSTAPFHVIQLVNLQVSQPTPTFSGSYYISICLCESVTQKWLCCWNCTSVKLMQEEDLHHCLKG